MEIFKLGYVQSKFIKDYCKNADGTDRVISFHNENLVEWKNADIPQPTEAEITAWYDSNADYFADFEVGNKRRKEYPAIVDQLDDIYHNGIDGWKATIKAVKDKYPK